MKEELFWTFATVTSYDHHGHFVAGLRQFGLELNSNGGYSFYLRGADRLGGVIDYGLNGFLDILPGLEDPLFIDAADANWKNFMESLEDYILNQPGGNVSNFRKTGVYGKRHAYNADDCLD